MPLLGFSFMAGLVFALVRINIWCIKGVEIHFTDIIYTILLGMVVFIIFSFIFGIVLLSMMESLVEIFPTLSKHLTNVLREITICYMVHRLAYNCQSCFLMDTPEPGKGTMGSLSSNCKNCNSKINGIEADNKALEIWYYRFYTKIDPNYYYWGQTEKSPRGPNSALTKPDVLKAWREYRKYNTTHKALLHPTTINWATNDQPRTGELKAIFMDPPITAPASSNAPTSITTPSSSKAPMPTTAPSSSKAPIPNTASSSSKAPMPTTVPSSSKAPMPSNITTAKSGTASTTRASTNSKYNDIMQKSNWRSGKPDKNS